MNTFSTYIYGIRPMIMVKKNRLAVFSEPQSGFI